MISKKLIQGLLVLILLGAATACQKNKSTDLLGNTVKTGKLEQVDLTMYIYGWGSSYQAYLDRLAGEIEKRSRKTLNIKLKFVMYIPGQYRTIINKLPGNSEGADLFITGGDSEVFDMAVESGVALDISSLFPRYAPEYYERIGNLATYYRKNGGTYAIPNYIPFKNKPCIDVREDLFKRYANGPINSIETLEKFMENVTANEDHIIPMSIDANSQSILSLFANYYGYAILDHDLGIVYKWNDPEMKLMAWEDTPEFPEMVGKVYEWYRKGYLKQRFAWAEMNSNYTETLWAGWISNQLSFLDLNAAQFEAGTGKKYLEFELFPDIPGQLMEHAVEGVIINANSPNPERAIMLIEWLHASQKNYDLIRYGFKNEDYALKGRQYYPGPDPQLGRPFRGLTWSFADIDYERVHIANSEKYTEEKKEAYMDPAARPPHFGFRVEALSVNPMYRRTNRFNIEYQIGRGDVNEKSTEQYRKEMKNNGIDQIVAEVQAQLNAWKKEQQKKQE